MRGWVGAGVRAVTGAGVPGVGMPAGQGWGCVQGGAPPPPLPTQAGVGQGVGAIRVRKANPQKRPIKATKWGNAGKGSGQGGRWPLQGA